MSRQTYRRAKLIVPQGFDNLAARMLLTVFQLKFHSKEVTFPGRSLHRGWHRNFRVPLMFKEALFSGAVVTPTARAKSPCKHAGKGTIQRQRRRRVLCGQTLTDIFRGKSPVNTKQRQSYAKQEGTLVSSSTATLPLPSQPQIALPFAHWCCYVSFWALIGLLRHCPALIEKKEWHSLPSYFWWKDKNGKLNDSGLNLWLLTAVREYAIVICHRILIRVNCSKYLEVFLLFFSVSVDI